MNLQDFAPQIIESTNSTWTSFSNAFLKNCLLNSTEHWQYTFDENISGEFDTCLQKHLLCSAIIVDLSFSV
jgi:hypothetical protein